jgi:hypothetical protein
MRVKAGWNPTAPIDWRAAAQPKARIVQLKVVFYLYGCLRIEFEYRSIQRTDEQMPEAPTAASLQRVQKLVQIYTEKSGTTTHPDAAITNVIVLVLNCVNTYLY